MSVSATTVSVSISSNEETTQVNSRPGAQASVTASATASSHGYNASSVNFHASQSQSGPVFGQQQQTASYHSNFNRPGHSQEFSAMLQTASHQGGTQQLQQWGKPWIGRPNPPINAHGPYPITLGKPDTTYSKKTNDELVSDFLKNSRPYTAGNRSTISRSAIEGWAQQKPGLSPVINRNIGRAIELTKRPEVMDAMFREPGTGAMRNQTSIGNLWAFSQNPNPLKYNTDKQVVQELSSHFEPLAGYFGKTQIDLNDLKFLAGLQRTGIPSLDHLINVSERTMDSSNLTGYLDRLWSKPGDNKISQEGLALASYMFA